MKTKEIHLAGGCFWGTERYLQLIPGVTFTQVGFANGNTPDPTYEEVYTDATGYAETVRVQYDPDVVPLRFLLEMYFKAIDPLSLNRQGHDTGTRYRTGIYWSDPADETVVREVADGIARSLGSPLAVELEPLRNFTPAEEYHQDYLVKHPGGYCHLSPELFEMARNAVKDK